MTRSEAGLSAKRSELGFKRFSFHCIAAWGNANDPDRLNACPTKSPVESHKYHGRQPKLCMARVKRF
jgi:hypothetical protein